MIFLLRGKEASDTSLKDRSEGMIGSDRVYKQGQN